jgi:hypothetical protein
MRPLRLLTDQADPHLLTNFQYQSLAKVILHETMLVFRNLRKAILAASQPTDYKMQGRRRTGRP